MVKFVSVCVERDKKNFEKMDFCAQLPVHLVGFFTAENAKARMILVVFLCNRMFNPMPQNEDFGCSDFPHFFTPYFPDEPRKSKFLIVQGTFVGLLMSYG